MLTFQFVPYGDIEGLSSHSRIQKILDIIKENKIILMEGRLRKKEEADLIRKTMEEIGLHESNDFKGIEISVIEPSTRTSDFLSSMRLRFINMLLGDRQGLTIVGPASIVKEIKQDPDKLQVFIDNYSSLDSSAQSSKDRDKSSSDQSSKDQSSKKKKRARKRDK